MTNLKEVKEKWTSYLDASDYHEHVCKEVLDLVYALEAVVEECSAEYHCHCTEHDSGVKDQSENILSIIEQHIDIGEIDD